MIKIVKPTSHRKSAITPDLSDLVSLTRQVIEPQECIEALMIALSNLISECELSSEFQSPAKKEYLRVLILFNNELINDELGAKAVSFVNNLFERKWATPKAFRITDLLKALEFAIKDQVSSGRKLEPEEQKELNLIRHLRNHLVKHYLGELTWELSESLLS